MRFELRTTTDGSLTLFDHEVQECFKSRHAARLEAEHVFFLPGIAENPLYGVAQPFRVLEFGFGLGTNYLHLKEKQLALEFVSVDRDLSGAKYFSEVTQIPLPILDTKREVVGTFQATLIEADFYQLPKFELFHAIFFDPFSPKANPEAWTEKLFALAFGLLHSGGRLVTYSVSRAAKDAAEKAGFSVEKRPLPPSLHKRSALVAIKP